MESVTVSGPRSTPPSGPREKEHNVNSGHMTLPEIKSYIDTLVSSAWFQKRWPIPAKPQVKDGRGSRRAKGGMFYVSFPQWARKEWVVLHELAHWISYRTYGFEGQDKHGRQWCTIYLELIEHQLGKQAADGMRDCFTARGVKYKLKQTRTLTPERREELRQRALVNFAAKGR